MALTIAATQEGPPSDPTYSTSPTQLNVNTTYWFAWSGGLANPTNTWGTVCDDKSNGTTIPPVVPPCLTVSLAAPYDIYAGYAYGQVYNWLEPTGASTSIQLCSPGSGTAAPCTDKPNSIWALPITETGPSVSEMAIWTWDGAAIACPGSTGCPSLTGFGHYLDLEGHGHTISGGSITLGEEP